MTIASIDLGSNSVILLIAEYDLENRKFISFKDYFTTPRISENISKTGIISEMALKRVDLVFSKFAEIIIKNNCEVTLCNATNAFRIARNAIDIKDIFEKRYNWNISIINGIEEARLSYIGTIINSFEDCTSLLIDIGGGSTEFIIGDGKSINYRKSLQLGVVSLYENYFNKFNYAQIAIENARTFIESKLKELDVRLTDDSVILAVAGTPTALSAIANKVKNYSNELIDKTTLELDQITSIRKRISKLSIDEMSKEFGDVVLGREELIVGGSLILETIMNYFHIKKIVVSTRGLRYGAVYDYLITNNYYTIKKW